MAVQKMKPCPKCKSTNVNATCWGMWKAWCRECLFEIDSFLEEKDAVEVWNNLVPQAESEDEDVEYQRQIEQLEHDILYEPTFNPEDGSM